MRIFRRSLQLAVLSFVLTACSGGSRPSPTPGDLSHSAPAPTSAGSALATSYVGIAPSYPVPATCPVASWTTTERRRAFPAFWLDGDGLAAGDPVGPLFFEGWQKIQWQAEEAGTGALQVTGQRLDGPAPPIEAQNVYEVAPATWSTGTVVPVPGCWRLQATAGTHHLDAIVYAYPAACRPASLQDPSVTPTTDRCAAA